MWIEISIMGNGSLLRAQCSKARQKASLVKTVQSVGQCGSKNKKRLSGVKKRKKASGNVSRFLLKSINNINVNAETQPLRWSLIEYFRVQVRDREIKVNIFDMAGHPFFYEVRSFISCLDAGNSRS